MTSESSSEAAGSGSGLGMGAGGCEPDVPPLPRREAPAWLESVALLAAGIGLMAFLYQCGAGPGGEVGAPGHDSFYHVRMAAMLPEHGLMREFPWLQDAWFTRSGDAFVSHHYGFHVLLWPFVWAAERLGGDPLAGGRWAIGTFFGLNLVLFNLLLRAGRVPYRWLWIVLLLLLPEQFFTRQAFIRAIGASLVFMQLLVLLIVTRRYVWAGLCVAAYVHLYLGAVLYAPLIVVLFVAAEVIGPAEERRWPVRLAAFTFAGWALGVVTYPYASGIWDFLRLQVFGSGLSPDIPVGREWQPYSDPWWFVSMAAVVLVVWVGAGVVRLRAGPRLNANEAGVLLVALALLVLTLKARRFVEYWPPMALLSGAYLAGPLLRGSAEAVREGWAWWRARWPLMRAGAAACGLVATGAVLMWAGRTNDTRLLISEWPLWSAVLALLALPALAAVWAETERTWRVALIVPAMGGLIVAGVATLAHGRGDLVAPRLLLPVSVWIAVGAGYVGAALWVYAGRRVAERTSWSTGIVRSAAVLVATFGLAGAAVAVAGPHLVATGRQTRCSFDLEAVREMMAFVKAHSEPGDIIFTDDWDIFPVFFYANTYNYYIVGLDPKFTHHRRPDLWERFVRITRGEVPNRSTVAMPGADGTTHPEQIDVRLDDIRDAFHARWVIADRDHRKLAEKLAAAPRLAELVYPCERYDACRDAAYVVFRIRAAGEAVRTAAPPTPDAEGHLYLSQLDPVAVEQGWGALGFDQSVDGGRLRIGGHGYRRGLGTHAESKLIFDVPGECTAFEAEVGIDDETDGEGSAVAAVYVDGERAFETPVLRGGSAAIVVRIGIAGAQQIALVAEPTADGNRHDHVDWGDALFVCE